MRLPSGRGPLSDAVFAALRGEPRSLPRCNTLPEWDSDDFQIALWVVQELSYRRIEGVDPRWEREPSLVALRVVLERAQEDALRRLIPRRVVDDVPAAVAELVQRDEGPSLSRWMEQSGKLEHMREFVAHRAAYQTKEADPHSLAIPRLRAGAAKSALLKIQLDEYGNAEPGQSHAELFADTMRVLDVTLDVDRLPAVTLRTNTVLTMFAAQRRLLGACLGHLAVFEMTSVEPMARYAATLRRVLPEGDATAAARFYDVHVAADGFHQELALHELLAGFAQQYPDDAPEVLFGAAALMLVETDFAGALVRAWEEGRSSLREPSTRAAA